MPARYDSYRSRKNEVTVPNRWHRRFAPHRPATSSRSSGTVWRLETAATALTNAAAAEVRCSSNGMNRC